MDQNAIESKYTKNWFNKNGSKRLSFFESYKKYTLW